MFYGRNFVIPRLAASLEMVLEELDRDQAVILPVLSEIFSSFLNWTISETRQNKSLERKLFETSRWFNKALSTQCLWFNTLYGYLLQSAIIKCPCPCVPPYLLTWYFSYLDYKKENQKKVRFFVCLFWVSWVSLFVLGVFLFNKISQWIKFTIFSRTNFYYILTENIYLVDENGKCSYRTCISLWTLKLSW